MKKPIFEKAVFTFFYNNIWYGVKFKTGSTSRHYKIIIYYVDGGHVIENYDELETATKTTALYYLCKALGISTKNVR